MSETTIETSKDSSSIEGESSVGQQLAGKFMTFKLAYEEYGLAILHVREIIGLMDVTRMPRTSECIRGVINLRGKVIPVVDLRVTFGMPPTQATEQTVIIVVHSSLGNGSTTTGILADEVLEVLHIAAEQIEPPLRLSSDGHGTDFILGIGKADKRVICLLDIERVLSHDEVNQVAAVSNNVQEP